MQQRLRHNEQRCAEDRLEPNKVLISPSDPESCLGRDKWKVFRPLYNVQYNSDVDTPLVLGYGVYAQSADAPLFKPMLNETVYFVGRQVPIRLGDSSFATGPNLAEAKKEKVTLYSPWQSNSIPKETKKKQIPKEMFRWDEQEQTYYCPEGHRLEKVRERIFRRSGTETALVEYRCGAEHCQGCPRAEQCARNPASGRTISRNQYEGEIAELRERMDSDEGKKTYKKRKATVERSFADTKEHRGLRRLSARGLRGAEIQVGLVVLVHNLLAVHQLLLNKLASSTAATSTETPL